MTKPVRMLNKYHIKEMLLHGNPQYENFYKEELIQFCKIAQEELKKLKSNQEKAIEYIKKDTRWFDSEYAKIYGTLCDCEGAKGDRLEVLVNPTNLLNILQGSDE